MGITAATVHRPLRVLAVLLFGICAVLFLGGLAFRATIYPKLPVAPGDAYGIADMIEYGIAVVLFLAAMAGSAVSVILILVRRLALVRIGIALLLISVLAPLGYYYLHAAVTRFPWVR